MRIEIKLNQIVLQVISRLRIYNCNFSFLKILTRHWSFHQQIHNKKSLPSLEPRIPQSTTKRNGLRLKRTENKMARLMTHKYLAGELTFITGRQRFN